MSGTSTYEQAAHLRAGRFALLDLEHLADEIEDVGKSEQRELASRMAVLLSHLLKWQYQPARRGLGGHYPDPAPGTDRPSRQCSQFEGDVA